MKGKNILLLLPIVLILTSCASNESSSGGQIDYDQTKKMVVDILKTDDGKKAIQDIMSDDTMKQKLVMDQQVVSDTIQKTLSTDKAQEFWKKTYSDPKFAQSVAKNMKAENQKLLKELMNDPEYRTMMIQVFKEPEIQKDLADALKSKDYRTHLQQVISETIQSPLFEAKMEQLLLKAAENLNKGKSAGGSQGGSQSGGGQSGGQGGGA